MKAYNSLYRMLMLAPPTLAIVGGLLMFVAGHQQGIFTPSDITLAGVCVVFAAFSLVASTTKILSFGVLAFAMLSAFSSSKTEASSSIALIGLVIFLLARILYRYRYSILGVRARKLSAHYLNGDFSELKASPLVLFLRERQRIQAISSKRKQHNDQIGQDYLLQSELYLGAFSYIAYLAYAWLTIDGFWRLGHIFDPERFVLKAVSGIGNVVAIGSDMAEGPVPKISSTDEKWKSVFAELVEASDLVLLYFGMSSAVAWEFEQVCSASSLREKTIIIMPPGTPADCWEALTETAVRANLTVPQYNEHGCALTISEAGTALIAMPHDEFAGTFRSKVAAIARSRRRDRATATFSGRK